jgi:hypothetical protein
LMMLANSESNEMFAVLPGDMLGCGVLVCVEEEKIFWCQNGESEQTIRTIDQQ